jgi:cytochrome c biogenesis protein CcmG, thiol:disulfide interchange protein DsbE
VTWIGLGVIALLFLAYLIWRPRPDSTDGVNHAVVGQRLVYLELEPLTGDGEAATLASVSGKVTLANVWGPWCPPCAEEFPYLAAIYEKFKNQPDFQYLSIAYSGGPQSDAAPDSFRDEVGEFVRRMRAEHPTHFDPGARTLFGLYAIGVENAFPTTMVIDRSGIIRGVWLGYDRTSVGEIERLLKAVLDE